MTLVSNFRAGRQAQKLRAAAGLPPEELKTLQDDLAAIGKPVIVPVADCLAHDGSNEAARTVLTRLINNYNLETFIGLLSSPNPTVVSGIQKVLSESNDFDPGFLIERLADKDAHRGRLEPILLAHIDRIPMNKVVKAIPALPRDAQAVLFRVSEKKAEKSAVPDLLTLLKHEEWWIRMQTARLLARISDETAVSALSSLLADPNKGVRYEAVRALHRMRHVAAIPQLVQILRDPDLKVQSAAIDALIGIGDVVAVQPLLALLTDQSEHVRRASVEVLNEVITTDAIQDLVGAMRDEDWWVRVRATDALGALGGEKVVEAVIGLFDTGDVFLRRQAVELLNVIPSESAITVLIRALGDEDWWVKERAIDALGSTGNPEAVEPLMVLMASDDQCAALCARALGALGDQRAVEPLTLLATSEDEEVSREASQALRAISETGRTGRVSPRGIRPDKRTAIPDAASTIKEHGKSGASLPFKVSAEPPPRPRRHSSIAEPARLAANVQSVSRPISNPPPSQPVSPVHAGRQLSTPPQMLNYSELFPETVLLDRYRVIRSIGKGGFGAVYLVEDSAISEQVVMKILNPHLSFDDSALKRFIRELKLTRMVTHSNVIRIYDFLELAGAHAVTMEYFPSHDLARVLLDQVSLDVKRGLAIMSQMCAGLSAAHAANVIHRDMKPANVLIGEDDVVKIVDFGLAAAQQQIESRLTKSGYLVGTPEYMAPEQIGSGEADHRVDIYALGIIMYELFSGVRPYSDETPVKVFFKHLEGGAQPLSTLVPDLPPGVNSLVMQAMAKDANDRPATVGDLNDLIEKEREALGSS
jgi:serine/threonine protein kinase/HEAT repeat protein